jgi:hypothetical protein
VALVAALALMVAAGTASAAKTTTIQWFGGSESGCRDGSATVPAGTFQITFGWGTYSTQYTQDFLGIQYVTYSVNGGQPVVSTVGDKAAWKQRTAKDGNGVTVDVAQYTSPTFTIASGQSITLNYSLKTTQDAYDNAQTSYPAGTELLGSYTTCTINAA